MAQHDKDIFSGLFTDPSTDQRMALIQAGLALLGKQRAGTSTIQNVANAGAQGINYLTNLERSRGKTALETQQVKNATTLAESQAANLNEATRLTERKTDQVDRQNQIQAYEALTNRQKSSFALKAALLKAKDIKSEDRQKIVIELIKQQTAKISAGLPSSPLEVISLSKLYLDPAFTMDGGSYDPETNSYAVYTYATSATDEDGKPVKEVIKGLNAPQVATFGLQPKALKTQALAQQKLQQEKSVPEISAEREITPTLPEIVAKESTPNLPDMKQIENRMVEQVKNNPSIFEQSRVQVLAQMLRNLPQGTIRFPTDQSALEYAILLLRKAASPIDDVSPTSGQ